MKEQTERVTETVPEWRVATSSGLTDASTASVGTSNGMLTYSFYFAPEGRLIDTLTASNVAQAKRIFYKTNSLYRKAKGEIYWTVSQVKPTLTKQEQFFYDNAGFSHDPKMESAEQGHVRCAQRLALAENWLRDADGIECEVSPDPYSDESFMDGESDEYKAEWSGKAWCVRLYSDSDPSLASLGSCYGDKKYERVVIAELALEIMPEVL